MVTFRFGNRRQAKKGSSPAGKLGASLFFFVFFAMGMLFEVFLVRELIRNAKEYSWKKLPCKIIGSSVEKAKKGEPLYCFTVEFEYEFNGRKYTSDVYRRDYRNSKTYSEADKLVRKYAQSSQNICYVNGSDPTKAVLKRNSLLVGLFIIVPSIFVLIGAGGLYYIWFGKAASGKKAPIAVRAKGNKGKYIAAVFFLIFALAGAGMLYPLSILPIARTIDAKSWIETPCKVLDARVRSHKGDDSTTFSVYILYEYTFEGQTYKSDRYSFVGGSSSGRKGKARVVANYRNAREPVCYVNPDSPHEAVLKRGFHVGLLLALVPLPFLLVGLIGLYCVVRGKGFKSRDKKQWLPADSKQDGSALPEVLSVASGSIVLKPKYSPFIKLLIALAFAAFWNGIISILVVSVVNDFRHHDPEWFKALFSVPFVLVGLGMIIYAIYQFLALFNPRPRLELRPGQVQLGTAAQLQWSFSGNVNRISELLIKLKGEEQATYRRGTKTHTDKRTFYEMELFKAADSVSISSGQTGFVMPEDTMHSFEAKNNKIIWSIEVHGDIAKWPDVKESFKIVITPVAVK